MAKVTVSSTVPSGWTSQAVGGLRFATPAAWAEIDSSAAATRFATVNPNVSRDQITASVLSSNGDPTTSDPHVEAYAITGTDPTKQNDWTVPDNAASWQLSVPGAGLSGFDVTTNTDDTFPEVELLASDGTLYDLGFIAPSGEAGGTHVKQFIESLSVA